MNYIKIWCEYDISGEFGGNNDEDILSVDGELDEEQINELLEKKYEHIFTEDLVGCNMTEAKDHGLFGWQFIDIEELK